MRNLLIILLLVILLLLIASITYTLGNINIFREYLQYFLIGWLFSASALVFLLWLIVKVSPFSTSDSSLNLNDCICQSSAMRFFDNLENSLNAYITKLEARAIINLTIGVLFSIIGISIGLLKLFYGSLSSELSSGSYISLFSYLGIILFVELFGYFFLRIYKDISIEINYFRNELTTLTFKKISLLLALQGGATSEDILLQDTVRNFLLMERNAVLKADESLRELKQLEISSKSGVQVSELGKLLAELKGVISK